MKYDLMLTEKENKAKYGNYFVQELKTIPSFLWALLLALKQKILKK